MALNALVTNESVNSFSMANRNCLSFFFWSESWPISQRVKIFWRKFLATAILKHRKLALMSQVCVIVDRIMGIGHGKWFFDLVFLDSASQPAKISWKFSTYRLETECRKRVASTAYIGIGIEIKTSFENRH